MSTIFQVLWIHFRSTPLRMYSSQKDDYILRRHTLLHKTYFFQRWIYSRWFIPQMTTSIHRWIYFRWIVKVQLRISGLRDIFCLKRKRDSWKKIWWQPFFSFKTKLPDFRLQKFQWKATFVLLRHSKPSYDHIFIPLTKVNYLKTYKINLKIKHQIERRQGVSFLSFNYWHQQPIWG